MKIERPCLLCGQKSSSINMNNWMTILAYCTISKNCANKACKTPIGKGQEVSGSLTHGRAKPLRKEPEGNNSIDEVINKTVKTGCV